MAEPIVDQTPGPALERDASGARSGVIVTGTPYASWMDIGRALAAWLGAPGADTASARVETDASAALKSTTDRNTRVLVLVDSPVRSLATWLAQAQGDSPSVAEALAAWRDGARRLLHLTQRAHGHCLLVDAAVARQQPKDLLALVARWQPTLATGGPEGAWDSVRPEPLGLALAGMAAASDHAALAVHVELRASCTPLSEAGQPPPDEPLPLDDALLAYRALAGGGTAASDAEVELLITQVQQLEAELKERMRTAVSATPLGADGRAAARPSIRLLESNEHGPHRHLHLECAGLEVLGHKRPKMDVRLLEHRGRPGLALFAPARGSKPLGAWHESGKEGERAFMMLVPADRDGAATLARLGTSDWLTLRQLVRSIAESAAADGSNAMVGWSVVALRLDRQLERLPVRVRYDKLAASRTGGDADASARLEVSIGAFLAGNRYFAQQCLRWSPGAASGSALEWLAPKNLAELPLLGWPLGPEGDLAPVYALPATESGLRAAVRTMSPEDRDLWLAVVDALQAVAATLAEAELPPGMGRAALQRQAAGIRRKLRRAIAGAQRRDALMGLMRRIRSRMVR